MNLAKLQDTNQYTEITCISIYYEKSEREIKEPIPFTIATKIIKYLGLNFLRRQQNCTQKIIDTNERNQR